jgi:Fe-S oxidoreductase
MRYANGHVSLRDRATTAVMGRTDLMGKAATATASLANAVVGAPSGSLLRRVVEKASGVSAVRLLPPYARQRFSTWFKQRPKVRIAKRQGRVAVFPTCLVEYQQPAIGHDLVKVYERNGIECSLADGASCCGAPWLHSGDVQEFTKVAEKNVKALAAHVRKGRDIVVPQPTCGYVLKKDYVDYVGGDDATLVAENTYDATEYLMKLHKADGTALDTDFTGFVPETVTYHTPCHLKAQNIGLKSRDLIKLTGAKVKLVQQCSGIDGMWGLRAENVDISVPIAGKLADEIRKADGDVVAGDCHLANTAISEQTGETPMHPLQLIARAYGIPEEGERP